MKHAIGAGVLFLLCCSSAAAAAPGESVKAAVAAKVKQFMTEREAPSVSVAVMTNGQLVLAEAYGTADVENFVPAEEETRYRIASVAKPMTAAAVLQLVDAGRLDLDAPIQRYVTKFPAKYGAVSIRDLLRHTGGVRHFKEGEFATTRRCEELAEGLEIFVADAMEHPPGERVTYSTYGYVLLGLAVEKGSGVSFAEYMSRHVFAPAGMTATRTDDYQALIPNRARGYAKSEGGGIRNADLVDTSCRIPAGGLIATATDVARFGDALLSAKLMRKASQTMMMTPQVPEETVRRTLAFLKAPAGYEPPGFGFGWAIGTPANRSAVWHGGNQQGTTSMIYLLPEKGQTIAILSNIEGQGDAITALADAIARVLQ